MSLGLVLITAVIGLALILFLQFQWKNRHIVAAAKKLPCPTTLPILGNALLFIGGVNTLRTVFTNITKQFKEAFCIWIGFSPLFVVANPEDVQIVLNSSTAREKDATYVFIKKFIGNGLLVSKGHIWRKYRRLINPMLHPTTIEGYLPQFNNGSRKLTEKLSETKIVDPRYELFNVSVDSAIKSFLGRKIDLSDQTKENIHELFDIIGRMTIDQFINIYLQIDWIFNLLYGKDVAKAMKGVAEFEDIYNEAVKEFTEEKKARESSKEPYEDEKHIPSLSLTIPEDVNEDHTWWHEVANLFPAATETGVSAMSFFLLTVATHPEAQARIRNEILEVMGDSKRDVTAKDIESLTYLNQALMESMRLHGVAPFIVRKGIKDIKLANGTLIPPGGRIIIPIHAMGWDPETFPEPHKYDPDRFSPENKSKRHKYAFIPFSAGPRNCIGKKYAIVLMKTVMVHILRNFEVRTNMRLEDIEYEVKIAMFSKHPIKLEFVKLNS